MGDNDDIEIWPAQASERRAVNGPVVAISQEALDRIQEHAAQDLRHELAGLLLGSVLEGDGQTLVRVEAAIAAQHLQSRRGSVTFTHKAWEYLNKVKDRDYPHKRIVGWYHTHPGFGIFLSEYDLFIQRNFFTAPWQVAYVVDPVAQQSGCFVWREGVVEQADSYDVYVPVRAGRGARQAARPAVEPFAATRAAPARPRRLSPVAAAMWVLLGLMAGMGAALLMAGQRTAPTPTVVSPPARQARKPAQATTTAPAVRPQVYYVVKPGDSLWRIAEQHYRGHGELWNFIAKANGLDLGASLEPGMRLRIPPMSEIYGGEAITTQPGRKKDGSGSGAGH